MKFVVIFLLFAAISQIALCKRAHDYLDKFGSLVQGTRDLFDIDEWDLEKPQQTVEYGDEEICKLERNKCMADMTGTYMHQGVYIETVKGTKLFIQAYPEIGVEIIPRDEMEKDCYPVETIYTQGLTVQQVFDHANGYSDDPDLNFYTAGLCVGTAYHVMSLGKQYKTLTSKCINRLY